MNTTNAFYCSYPNGVGYSDVIAYGRMVSSLRKHEGCSICFRDKLEFLYRGEQKIDAHLLSSNTVIMTVEFKTVASGSKHPDSTIKVALPAGESDMVFDIPKTLSPIKEICFSVLKSDNPGTKLVGYAVTRFELF